MHIRTLSIAAALIAGAASFTSTAQAGDNTSASQPTLSGEGNPIPAAIPAMSRADRLADRIKHRQEAASVARTATVGEGDPMPTRMTVRAEGGPTRAERLAEVRRANRAGELHSGE